MDSSSSGSGNETRKQAKGTTRRGKPPKGAAKTPKSVSHKKNEKETKKDVDSAGNEFEILVLDEGNKVRKGKKQKKHGESKMKPNNSPIPVEEDITEIHVSQIMLIQEKMKEKEKSVKEREAQYRIDYANFKKEETRLQALREKLDKERERIILVKTQMKEVEAEQKKQQQQSKQKDSPKAQPKAHFTKQKQTQSLLRQTLTKNKPIDDDKCGNDKTLASDSEENSVNISFCDGLLLFFCFFRFLFPFIFLIHFLFLFRLITAQIVDVLHVFD
jgi:hypothetical protein